LDGRAAGVPDRRGDRAGRQLGGDRVVLALEVDVERDVGHRHGCEPGIEQRAASRVRVGEVERAAVGHLVVGASGSYSGRMRPSAASAQPCGSLLQSSPWTVALTGSSPRADPGVDVAVPERAPRTHGSRRSRSGRPER
jgi:hypothetical protein